jgi:MinD-like ATPase involved in chromosome partitioning or flagellar assembly
MTKTIGIHSFRRGTGKTFFAVNLSLLLAREGWRVGLVDTDFQSPDLHAQFGLGIDGLPFTLNDYLDGKCEVGKIYYDVTNRVPEMDGRLYVIPASNNQQDITKILRQGYPVEKLADALRQINQSLALDSVVIDTSAGLTEESLRSLALADSLAVVMLPDLQHYQGTAVITDLARQLSVPSISLVINQVPDFFDPVQVRREIEDKYQTAVAAVLPFVDECGTGERFFVLDYPEHSLTLNLMQMVLGLLK